MQDEKNGVVPRTPQIDWQRALPQRQPPFEKSVILRRLVWEIDSEAIKILFDVSDRLERQELIAQAIGALGSLCEAWRGSPHRWTHKARMRVLVAALSLEMV
jgi:hypothetical protein